MVSPASPLHLILLCKSRVLTAPHRPSQPACCCVVHLCDADVQYGMDFYFYFLKHCIYFYLELKQHKGTNER